MSDVEQSVVDASPVAAVVDDEETKEPISAPKKPLRLPDAVEKAVGKALVPTSQAARFLGVSEPTVLRKARELGGRRGAGGRWLFEIETLRVIREDGTRVQPGPKGQLLAPRSDHRGELAAEVFKSLEAGKAIQDIVIDLHADPAHVRALVDEWQKCRELTLLCYGIQPKEKPLPALDHPPVGDWTCCPGHEAQKRMLDGTKK